MAVARRQTTETAYAARHHSGTPVESIGKRETARVVDTDAPNGACQRRVVRCYRWQRHPENWCLKVCRGEWEFGRMPIVRQLARALR